MGPRDARRTLTGEILPRYTQGTGEEPFAFEGKTLGRSLEEPATAS